MLLSSTILIWINNLIKKLSIESTYGSDLENYIISKHPQSVYEVEYWATQYDKTNSKGWMI